MHKELVDLINTSVPGSQATLVEALNSDPVIYVDAAKILEVCRYLRDNPKYPFKVLQSISGVDYPPERIDVCYMLATFDPNSNHEMILKVKVPRDQPELETVSSVWKAADWQERECFDMLGVVFKNHPDPRRILCPDDWEGFPLRKDYQVAEKYKHMTINPAAKMNYPERGFVDLQKKDLSAKRPELNW